MNQEFETVVMNTYAELCIMWRVAHVTNQAQAEDFDAKLKSLEAVVAAFDLNTPTDAADAAPAPAPAGNNDTEDSPPPREQSTGVPRPPEDAGLVLED